MRGQCDHPFCHPTLISFMCVCSFQFPKFFESGPNRVFFTLSTCCLTTVSDSCFISYVDPSISVVLGWIIPLCVGLWIEPASFRFQSKALITPLPSLRSSSTFLLSLSLSLLFTLSVLLPSFFFHLLLLLAEKKRRYLLYKKIQIWHKA